MPAGLLGSEVPTNLNTLARSFHAIPVINACDVDGVIRDVYDVGRAYQPLDSLAFVWGAAYNAGVAHAMRLSPKTGNAQQILYSRSCASVINVEAAG